jgi:hypothetical protein
LTVCVVGAYPGLEAFETLLIEIAEACRALQRWRVLLDVTAMTDPVPPLHRFLVGKRAARLWRRRIKVAALAKSERITRFFEHVAVNEGGNVRVFAEPDAAHAWLRTGKLAG